MLRALTISILTLSLFSCEKAPAPAPAVQKETPTEQQKESEAPPTTESMKVTITAAGKAFTATIEGSETGKAFIQRLPMTLEMSELNGNEKYCYGVALPHNDSRYDRIEAGDIMLYSGDCVVLFYGPAGGYSYTRIGKIEDITGLADALGRGSVSVKFEKQ